MVVPYERFLFEYVDVLLTLDTTDILHMLSLFKFWRAKSLFKDRKCTYTDFKSNKNTTYTAIFLAEILTN